MSPVFAHGHLRLYLLVLLADHPMHGYELIQALGDRFGGTYVPSAGTVYPRLAKLEEEGLVSKTADGRKTVYAITEAGRTELAARADEIAAVESGVADSVKSLADGVRASVGEAMRSSVQTSPPRRRAPAPVPTRTPSRCRRRAPVPCASSRWRCRRSGSRSARTCADVRPAAHSVRTP
ncbi:PadR family transcriptional regulator [Sphingomonas sp. LR61]|uniref:PadR family transcriptional regulator n=1 Tax=Sphingomonas sp. LR61 TaxID=3050234 RepID=UPI002FE2CB21